MRLCHTTHFLTLWPQYNLPSWPCLIAQTTTICILSYTNSSQYILLGMTMMSADTLLLQQFPSVNGLWLQTYLIYFVFQEHSQKAKLYSPIYALPRSFGLPTRPKFTSYTQVVSPHPHKPITLLRDTTRSPLTLPSQIYGLNWLSQP